MEPQAGLTPRDPAKPVEYYEALVALEERSIDYSLNKKAPVLFRSIADKSLRIARALYSAGEPVVKCRHWLENAGNYEARFLREGVNFKLIGLGDLGGYLERFSSASLAGRAGDVVDAFRQCTVEGIGLWEKGIMDHFCAVLTSETYVPTKDETEALQKRLASYQCLPAIFHAVEKRDQNSFARALEDYLVKLWGPSADRAARRELKSADPIYTGTWSFFSVALCDLIGFMPDLSKKAKKHVPVDLFPS
jgi:Domain of unknown function (DUF1911)